MSPMFGVGHCIKDRRPRFLTRKDMTQQGMVCIHVHKRSRVLLVRYYPSQGLEDRYNCMPPLVRRSDGAIGMEDVLCMHMLYVVCA